MGVDWTPLSPAPLTPDSDFSSSSQKQTRGAMASMIFNAWRMFRSLSPTSEPNSPPRSRSTRTRIVGNSKQPSSYSNWQLQGSNTTSATDEKNGWQAILPESRDVAERIATVCLDLV